MHVKFRVYVRYCRFSSSKIAYYILSTALWPLPEHLRQADTHCNPCLISATARAHSALLARCEICSSSMSSRPTSPAQDDGWPLIVHTNREHPLLSPVAGRGSKSIEIILTPSNSRCFPSRARGSVPTPRPPGTHVVRLYRSHTSAPRSAASQWPKLGTFELSLIPCPSISCGVTASSAFLVFVPFA